jgi:hypothetical protein
VVWGSPNAVARKHANEFHALVLLRYRRERPRRCSAADQADELAPRHVRTWDQEDGILAAQPGTLIGANPPSKPSPQCSHPAVGSKGDLPVLKFDFHFIPDKGHH